jgi:hypothetical protein
MSPQWTVPFMVKVEEKPSLTLEVKSAVVKLKTYRLNSKLLKVDEVSSILRLRKLIDKIWKKEIFPSLLEEGLIYPTYKNGNRVMCENYCSVCRI